MTINGHFRSVDEMIVEGVRARSEGKRLSRGMRSKTPAEAVARKLRQGNRLPAGITIKRPSARATERLRDRGWRREDLYRRGRSR